MHPGHLRAETTRRETGWVVRVLVIDDEPDVLLLCRVNFEFAGHQVLQAPDGERGRDLAVTERPDLIVLDIMLPAKDGLTILRELLEAPETHHTPVVLLTAKTQEEDRLAGWRAGAVEYVTKPFSPIVLTQIAEQVLGMTLEQREERRERALAELQNQT